MYVISFEQVFPCALLSFPAWNGVMPTKKKTKTAVLCCITAANNQILQINIFFFIRWFQMLVSGTNVWQLSLQIQYY